MIKPINIYNNNQYKNNGALDNKQKNNQNNNPNFTGAINLIGNVVGGIERGGFPVQFIVNDTAGMTLPRTLTGLNCNKEELGHLNYKEGGEVAIREGVTGPTMIVAPILVLLAASAFAKSAAVSSSMLKRFKPALSDVMVNLTQKPSATELKRNIYKATVEKTLNDTLQKTPEAGLVDTLVGKLSSLTGKGKNDKNILGEINDIFNTAMKNSSSDFQHVNSVKLGDTRFATTDFAKGIRAFAEDAAKKIEKINTTEYTQFAEKFTNESIGKRIATNVAAIGTTIGAMKLVPKLYAFNAAPPSVTGATSETKAPTFSQPEQSNKNGNVSFTGGWDRLGKTVLKAPEKLVNALEFKGYDVTPALMALITIFGLVGPRVDQANKRAPIKPDGTKDRREVIQILKRDPISAASVVFAVPIFSKLLIGAYEKPTGFILTNGGTEAKTTVKKVLDFINPVAAFRNMTNAELESIYGKLENRTQLNNFCEYVKSRGGNLAKIFSASEEAKSVLGNLGANVDELKKLKPEVANARIIEKLRSISDDAIQNLTKDQGIFKRARALNSIPTAIAMFILTPLLLGVIIPKLAYSSSDKDKNGNTPTNNLPDYKMFMNANSTFPGINAPSFKQFLK